MRSGLAMIFVAATALAGCDSREEREALKAAQSLPGLGNPGSIQVRNVRRVPPAVLCGEVVFEGRSSWSGWQRFYVGARGEMFLRDSGNLGRKIYQDFCEK